MRYMKEIKPFDIVKAAISHEMELIGDDFIGFKFIGSNSEFWNGLLMKCEQEDLIEFLNSESFKENNIPYSDYDSDRWKLA